MSTGILKHTRASKKVKGHKEIEELLKMLDDCEDEVETSNGEW